MRRRDLLLALSTPLPAVQRQSPRRPNIIFVLADDLGYGDLGCYGQKRISTPCIDAFAHSGIRFTQAYAGSPVCAPSRCCFITGKHSGHATIRWNRSTAGKRVPLKRKQQFAPMEVEESLWRQHIPRDEAGRGSIAAGELSSMDEFPFFDVPRSKLFPSPGSAENGKCWKSVNIGRSFPRKPAHRFTHIPVANTSIGNS